MQTKFERKLDWKLILSILATGLMSFTGVVVETSMNITFPTLMKEFGVSTSTVQWVTTGYLLILTLVIPISSFVKKRFKMKTLFIFAIVTFVIGTLMGLLAPSFWVLLLGRLIQGIGTGIALPLMFNIILDQAPFDKMGFIMGIAAMITAVAPAVGPSVGGLIVSKLGWRYIFAVLLPLLVLAFVFGIIAIRQSSEIEKPSLDFGGYLLLGGTFVALIFASSFAGQFGWLSWQVLGLFVLAIALIAVYCVHAKKSEHPIIDFSVFSYSQFSFSIGALLMVYFCVLGLGFIIPNFSQLALKTSALTAGCILLPGCALGAVMNPIAGKLLDRFGAAKPLVTGCVLVLAAAVCYCLPLESTSVTKLTIYYVIFQLGAGSITGNTLTNGLKCLPAQKTADGNALFTTCQQLAGAIGTAVTASVISNAQANNSDIAKATIDGSHTAFIIVAAAAVILTVCTIGAVTRKPHMKGE